MTLFTRVIKNVDLLKRVWDLYFMDGVMVLFKVAITVLRLLMDMDLLWDEMEDILMTLQQASNHLKMVGEDQFLTLMEKVYFPPLVIDEIPLLKDELFR